MSMTARPTFTSSGPKRTGMRWLSSGGDQPGAERGMTSLVAGGNRRAGFPTESKSAQCVGLGTYLCQALS